MFLPGEIKYRKKQLLFYELRSEHVCLLCLLFSFSSPSYGFGLHQVTGQVDTERYTGEIIPSQVSSLLTIKFYTVVEIEEISKLKILHLNWFSRSESKLFALNIYYTSLYDLSQSVLLNSISFHYNNRKKNCKTKENLLYFLNASHL